MNTWPKTARIETGPALHCYECDSHSPVTEEEREDLIDCPNCGSGTVVGVEISECPDPENCHADTHHYALCVHVEGVEE